MGVLFRGADELVLLCRLRLINTARAVLVYLYLELCAGEQCCIGAGGRADRIAGFCMGVSLDLGLCAGELTG